MASCLILAPPPPLTRLVQLSIRVDMVVRGGGSDSLGGSVALKARDDDVRSGQASFARRIAGSGKE